MAITFAVSEWSGWVSGKEPGKEPDLPTHSAFVTVSDVPDVSSLPPLLRRRLNFMGRACVSVMLRHLEEDENLPIVFCSRHGDIERTLSVLADLASGNLVSPMNFSLAVHNAIAGVLSIHRNITKNISCIAAGEEDLVPAFLEAAGLLSEDCPKILCVFCDVTLPEIYLDQQTAQQVPFVACFKMTRGPGLELELTQAMSCKVASSQQPIDQSNESAMPEKDFSVAGSALGFVEFLSSPQPLYTTVHNGAQWHIHKVSAL